MHTILDPAKPLDLRALVRTARSGRPLVLFLDTRAAVAGQSMTSFHVAALIAEKSDGLVTAVRLAGAEGTFLSRVPAAYVGRRLFPKIKVTILPPQRIAAPSGPRGPTRRQARRLGLYDRMTELQFLTFDIRRTLHTAFEEQVKARGLSHAAVEDPLSGPMSLRMFRIAVALLARKLAALSEPGETIGIMLPNAISIRPPCTIARSPRPSPKPKRHFPWARTRSSRTMLATPTRPRPIAQIHYRGTEAVKAETRRVFMEKFGLAVLEGYGVTEASPVIAVNVPAFSRTGTVGRLLPLVEPRFEPVPGIEDGAKLSVSGPNIMLGYYRPENPGVIEAPPGGSHDTGDIVAVDEEGFVAIKGRAKRFAKIAGETVSLASVEDFTSDLWSDHISAAVAAPDPKRGERVILATTKPGATRAGCKPG